jgi:uncharacterized paraquat-inducible protein A
VDSPWVWSPVHCPSNQGKPNLTPFLSFRELARCAPEAPRLERPLYRGAIIASVWVLLLLFLLIAVQFPFTLIRLSGVENPEQAMALMKSLADAKTPDTLMIAADVVSAVVNLILRPLLAISFLVLYYDAKARWAKVNDEQVRSE